MAGVVLEGPEQLSAHALRVGFITEADARGVRDEDTVAICASAFCTARSRADSPVSAKLNRLECMTKDIILRGRDT